MSSNEIIPAGSFGVAKYADDKTFDVVASGGAYLPRIQLYGGNSDACKEGKIGIGRYGLVKDKNLTDLTAQFDCLPLSWRPKAMELKDGNVNSFYNPAHAEFKRIQGLADVKDSGCMFGPEFLLWIPSVEQFATLFMNNKTMRRAAPEIKALLGRPMTLKTQLIKAKGYVWHGPVVTQCSTPFDTPDMAVLREQAEKFNNPAESEVEVAPEATRDR